MRQVVLGEEIQIFGDGAQRRDFDYVDDVVDAFLRAGAMDAADGQVFNLGGEAPVSLLDLVKLLIEIAGGRARYRLVPFPPERKRIDIGDFYADTTQDPRRRSAGSRGSRCATGSPRTIDYYRAHKEHYL